MSKPLVSVIIPLFNAEKFIAASIGSVVSQTWTNIEIVIVNDGSEDNSLHVARSFENDLVRVFDQENRGASAARNFGLKEARGEYIQFLDADDLLAANKVENQMLALKGAEDTLALGPAVYFVDGTDPYEIQIKHEWYRAGADDPIDFATKLLSTGDILPGFGGMIPHHSWLVPKILIEQAGNWNEHLSYDDDGEFYWRMILAARKILYVPNAVCYYRKFRNGNNLSASNSTKSMESHIKSLDLKYKRLTSLGQNPLINSIFSRHYWEIGVRAFPQLKELSKQGIARARELGYTGSAYQGGLYGKKLADIFGWKAARILSRLIYKI